MDRKIGILVLILVAFLADVISGSSTGLASGIKLSFNAPAISAFWVSDGELIGVREAGKYRISVVDINGKTVWRMEEQKGQSYLTDQLQLIWGDTLLALSPENGNKVWEKQISGENFSIVPGTRDGFFAVSSTNRSQNVTEIKVFSKAGEPVWQYINSDEYFQPIRVILDGKAIVGMTIDPPKLETKIQIIDFPGVQRTIRVLKDDAPLLSGEAVPIVITNEATKQILVAVPSTPWWVIVSASGDIVANEQNSPVRNPIIAPLGSGFAFASEAGDKVVFVSEKGKLMWSKNIVGPIWGLTGNSSHLAIITGNMGRQGKILLYNTVGKMEDSIAVSNTPTQIQIAKSRPLVIGVLDYARVFLYDFSR
ncbi:MAG: PQQ-like beta-propeller repeat protein [Deltaproteobacteria bacterium]|nr:PQQ-like beta-propeller repeat protein [Deltaproteobacteria bacterium]